MSVVRCLDCKLDCLDWLIINHGCFKLAGQWFTRNIIPSDHSRNGSLPCATSWLLWEGLFHVYWSIKWSMADWKICLFLKRTKSTDSSFAVNLVTPEEFRLEISYIPNNKSHGLYLCPTQILKCSSNLISGILVNILKTSISTGVYPSEQWQRLFRFSNKMIILTLTIIGRLFYFFNFNRIFEKIVFKRMESFIEQKNLLTPSQYGFRKAHSTQHAILDIVNAIQTNMNNCLFSCGIFIDLKKAFDTVDHEILLHKLDHYGFHGIINIWFSSYLQGKTQTTQIRPHISERLDSTWGVPQGSVLGPQLFLLYINDIQESSDKLSFYLFLEDINILFTDKNLKSLELYVNQELNKVYDWLTANKLTLNIKKSNLPCPKETFLSTLNRDIW